jgi:hypothetical protein
MQSLLVAREPMLVIEREDQFVVRIGTELHRHRACPERSAAVVKHSPPSPTDSVRSRGACMRRVLQGGVCCPIIRMWLAG